MPGARERVASYTAHRQVKLCVGDIREFTLELGDRDVIGAGHPQGMVEKRDHLARVNVSDEVWVAFRQAAGRRHSFVSRYLGSLVEREVIRLRAADAREEGLRAQEAAGALEEAQSLKADLEGIAQRLEWAIRWGRTDVVPAPRSEPRDPQKPWLD